jgi:hypothetical protein
MTLIKKARLNSYISKGAIIISYHYYNHWVLVNIQINTGTSLILRKFLLMLIQFSVQTYF